MKFQVWDGEDLEGIWEVSTKLDGVRCHKTPDGVVSRSGKPLYNIPDFDGEVAEVYCGSFRETIIRTRTKNHPEPIKLDEIYVLEPTMDKRLFIAEWEDPTRDNIMATFLSVKGEGLEGLVLNNGAVRLKVKSRETFDVLITGIVEGKGRNIGRLGCFKTDMGNVGTGFTDQERTDLFDNDLIGKYVEVDCMELTEDGKFRHPRYMRIRYDK